MKNARKVADDVRTKIYSIPLKSINETVKTIPCRLTKYFWTK